MKATKKIVGAACALVAATALAAGSTFAWFTSNGTVDAKGLEIEVNTNNSYLIIGKDTGDLANGKKEISLADLGKYTEGENAGERIKILPSSYMTATPGAGNAVTLTDNTLEGGNTSGASVVTESTWYTAQGTDSDNGAIVFYKVGDPHPTDKYAEGDTVDGNTLAAGDPLIGTAKPIETGDPLIGTPIKKDLDGTSFKNYVVVADMVISISKGSTAVEHVKATMDAKVTEETKDCPLHVVFLYQTVAPKTTGDTPAWGDLGAWTKMDVAVTAGLGTGGVDLGPVESSDHYIAIKVMVYMDGHDEKVKTTNSANLSGVKIDFQFNDPAQTGSGS